MSDEQYVIDICDQVLGLTASRQHRFTFLLGDPDENGRCVKLPVDAYYDALQLVIEYRERQHTEAVPFFDQKQTVSGCGRGEQRRQYDQRRRDVLPKHGIVLIELEYDMFAHNGSKRLKRDAEADERVIRRVLSERVNLHGAADERVIRRALSERANPHGSPDHCRPNSFAAWRQVIGQACLRVQQALSRILRRLWVVLCLCARRLLSGLSFAAKVLFGRSRTRSS